MVIYARDLRISGVVRAWVKVNPPTRRSFRAPRGYSSGVIRFFPGPEPTGSRGLHDDIRNGIFFEKKQHRRYGQVENIPQPMYFFAHDDIIPVMSLSLNLFMSTAMAMQICFAIDSHRVTLTGLPIPLRQARVGSFSTLKIPTATANELAHGLIT